MMLPLTRAPLKCGERWATAEVAKLTAKRTKAEDPSGNTTEGKHGDLRAAWVGNKSPIATFAYTRGPAVQVAMSFCEIEINWNLPEHRHEHALAQ